MVAVVLCWVLTSYFGRRALYLFGVGFNALFLLGIGIAASVPRTNASAWVQAVFMILVYAQYGLPLDGSPTPSSPRRRRFVLAPFALLPLLFCGFGRSRKSCSFDVIFSHVQCSRRTQETCSREAPWLVGSTVLSKGTRTDTSCTKLPPESAVSPSPGICCCRGCPSLKKCTEIQVALARNDPKFDKYSDRSGGLERRVNRLLPRYRK